MPQTRPKHKLHPRRQHSNRRDSPLLVCLAFFRTHALSRVMNLAPLLIKIRLTLPLPSFVSASQGSHGYCHGVHVERLNGTGRKQFALLHLSIFYKTLFIRQVSPCGRQYLCFTAYQTYDLLQSNELAPSLHSFHPSYPFPLGHNLYPLRPVPDRDASCECSPGVAEGSVKDSI